MNFSTYKFRASSLPKLLLEGRNKDGLSETLKAYLRELWIRETFQRERIITIELTHESTKRIQNKKRRYGIR